MLHAQLYFLFVFKARNLIFLLFGVNKVLVLVLVLVLKSSINQMELPPSASCECCTENQTAQHIASECPQHSCNGDVVVLDTAAHNWLHDLQSDV